jgi:hypothetical protein
VYPVDFRGFMAATVAQRLLPRVGVELWVDAAEEMVSGRDCTRFRSPKEERGSRLMATMSIWSGSDSGTRISPTTSND